MDFGPFAFGLESRGLYRVIIPDGLYDWIRDKVKKTHWEFIGHPFYMINSCDPSLFEYLPIINVKFGDGQIAIYPNQYFHFDPSACLFRLKAVPWSSYRGMTLFNTRIPPHGSLGFNPLLIPGMNIHVSSSGIVEVCSSRVLEILLVGRH